jgi:hypothetical protein
MMNPIALAVLLSVVAPAMSHAQTERLAKYSDSAKTSAHYPALIQSHPLLASGTALKKLPWQAPVDGVFKTRPLVFGKGSSWTVSFQADGKMDLRFRLGKGEDVSKLKERLTFWANHTIDARGIDESIDGDVFTLLILNITDSDLEPSGTAAHGGRALYLDQLVEYFYGSPAAANGAGKEAIPAVLSANAALGTALSQPLAQSAARANQNFFFSPYSISTAWTMVTLGASPATQAEMLKLYGTSISASTLKSGASALQQAIFPAGQQNLVTANSIWLNRGVRLLPAYQKEMKSLFAAEVQSRDLGTQSTVNEINGWIEKSTLGLVKDVIKKPDPSVVFYLINTLGVKVKWKNAFDTAKTSDRAFTTAAGQTKSVPTMYQKGKFYYVANEQVKGVSLGTEDGSVVVDFYLPNEGRSAEQVAQSLDVGQIRQWLRRWSRNKRG